MELAVQIMTPDELQSWRQRRGYTIDKAAEMLCIGRAGLEHYLYGHREIPPSVVLTIEMIDRNPKAAERIARRINGTRG